MWELTFIIIRFPFFLIGTVFVGLFWFSIIFVSFVVGSVLSLFVLVYCALTNNPTEIQKWLNDFGKWLREAISHWGEGNDVCWKFLIRQP